MTDPDFDDLNPPLSPTRGDTFAGLIVWAFLLWGLVSVARSALT